MQKIQNNGPQRGERARWAAGAQSNSTKYNRFGAVTRVLQHPSTGVATAVPSLAEQAACAARDKGMADYSGPLSAEIEAAYKLLSRGQHVPSPSREVTTALLSGRLRAELDAKANAARSARQQARQKQLTERDYVTIHVSPHTHQSESLEQTLVQRLQDCVPKSKWPGQGILAAQASDGLNRFILDQLAAEESTAAGGSVAALSAVLTGCDIFSSECSLTETPMRCKCEREVVATSGLLPPTQKRIKVVLPCGLALTVEAQPDQWQMVRVMMTGLSPAIKLADATFIVADLLKGTGAEFTLTAPNSQANGAESEQQDGLKRLNIRLVSPPAVSASRGAQAVRQSKRDLVLQTRRDTVHLLPPARSVLVVTPATPSQPETSELTYIKFEVNAQDGHTDARKCYSCGRDGHIAATCTAARTGQVADYVVYAKPPAQASRPLNKATVRRMQTPSSVVNEPQARQVAASAPDADGFSTDRRQLNHQPARNVQQTHAAANTVAAAAGPVSANVNTAPTVPPPRPASPPSATGAVAGHPVADTQQPNDSDEPVDAEVLALSEREELPNQMQQLLQARHEALALCMLDDGTVAPQHAQQFDELVTAHMAAAEELSAAHGRVKTTLTKLNTEPMLPYTPGKAKAKKNGAKYNAEEQEAARKHNLKLNTDIARAKCVDARFMALKQQYQAFARRLDTLRHVDTQLQSDNDQQDSLHTPTANLCESPMSPVIAMPPESQDDADLPRSPTAGTLETVTADDMEAAVTAQPQSCGSEVHAASTDSHDVDTTAAVAVTAPAATVTGNASEATILVAPEREPCASELHAATTNDHAASTAVTAAATTTAPVTATVNACDTRASPPRRDPSTSHSTTRAAELEQRRTEVLSRSVTDLDLAEQQGVRAEQARLLRVDSSKGESATERDNSQHSDSEHFDSEGSESECSDAPTTPQRAAEAKRANSVIGERGPTLKQQLAAVIPDRELRQRPPKVLPVVQDTSASSSKTVKATPVRRTKRINN
jgi:hypothetical protein